MNLAGKLPILKLLWIPVWSVQEKQEKKNLQRSSIKVPLFFSVFTLFCFFLFFQINKAQRKTLKGPRPIETSWVTGAKQGRTLLFRLEAKQSQIKPLMIVRHYRRIPWVVFLYWRSRMWRGSEEKVETGERKIPEKFLNLSIDFSNNIMTLYLRVTESHMDWFKRMAKDFNAILYSRFY